LVHYNTYYLLRPFKLTDIRGNFASMTAWLEDFHIETSRYENLFLFAWFFYFFLPKPSSSFERRGSEKWMSDSQE
jgi:hypothetical protein